MVRRRSVALHASHRPRHSRLIQRVHASQPRQQVKVLVRADHAPASHGLHARPAAKSRSARTSVWPTHVPSRVFPCKACDLAAQLS